MPSTEVRPPREPLREAVEEHPGQRERAQQQAERIEQPTPRARTARPPATTDAHASRTRQRAARQLAVLRARIARVELAVDDAVEAHRREARGGEREHHQRDDPRASPARRSDAASTPTSANGSANSVCGSLTKFDVRGRAATRRRTSGPPRVSRASAAHTLVAGCPSARPHRVDPPLRRLVHLDHGPATRA